MVKPTTLVLIVSSASTAAALAFNPYSPQPVQRNVRPRIAAPQITQPPMIGRVFPRQTGGQDTAASNTDGQNTPPSASTTSETAKEDTTPSSTSTSTSEVQSTTKSEVSTERSTPASTPASQTSQTSAAVNSGSASNTGGVVVTNSEIVILSASQTSASATSSATESAAAKDSSSGLSSKSIIGMVVAGVLALLGIGAFVWWKMSKKRFADFDDDNGAIKWPEFQNSTAMTAIGNKDNDKDIDSRPESQQGFNVTHSRSASVAASAPYHDNYSASNVGSTADLSRGPVDYASNDPYAVPPHLAQPYHDDPHAGGYNDGYTHYDPYSGPVPGAFDPQATPVAANFNNGRQSPGPNMAYVGNERSMSPAPSGRMSPGPNAAYATGRASPGPNMAYGGRTSPGPNVAYGGRTSPGPNMAYASGRTSPGPNMAYGGRSASPGPNMAYGDPGRAASPGPNMAYGGGRQSPGPNNAYHGNDMR